jgi:predicted RecB family nuclease
MDSRNRAITKAVFLAGICCPKQGWLSMRADPKKADNSTQFMLEQGRLVELEARRLYPDGDLIQKQQDDSTTDLNHRLAEAEEGHVFFEAEFRFDNCVARPDILRREANGWHLIEVKSGTSLRPKYVDDVAYTTMVVEDAGIPISRISLMLLNPEFEVDGPPHDRYFYEEVTERTQKKANEFRRQRPRLTEALLNDVPPAELFIYACKTCPYFSEPCLGESIHSSIFNLPGIIERQFKRIASHGYKEIAEVPRLFLITAKQTATQKAIATGTPVVKRQRLGSLLREVQWPAYYLDFETCAVAMPKIPHARPYEQIPTQYSLHVFSAPHELDNHYD